jgi:hypothetical protein
METLTIPEFQKAHPSIDVTEDGIIMVRLPPPKSIFAKAQL